MTERKRLAILGAGPIGLEAALRAAAGDYDVTVFERGDAAANVRRWGHVTLFSPFGMNRSDAGRDAVAQSANTVPDDDAVLTGAQYVESYLAPLADTLARRIRLQTHCTVLGVGRQGVLKHELIGDPRRGELPFRLLYRRADGTEHAGQFDIVIDATGTYGTHNWLGGGGIPAVGETPAANRISYGLDDIVGADRLKYADNRIMLVGGAYSAATSVAALSQLRLLHPSTSVVWLTRNASQSPIPLIDNDRLPQRRALAERANDLARGADNGITHHPGTTIERIDTAAGALRVTAADRRGAQHVFDVDRVIANVGYQPDASIYRELQVQECYATLGPIKLAAALLGESSADCLDRSAPAADVLKNPEPNFYILGAKSYGRNSTFLVRAGLQQIAQVLPA